MAPNWIIYIVNMWTSISCLKYNTIITSLRFWVYWNHVLVIWHKLKTTGRNQRTCQMLHIDHSFFVNLHHSLKKNFCHNVLKVVGIKTLEGISKLLLSTRVINLDTKPAMCSLYYTTNKLSCNNRWELTSSEERICSTSSVLTVSFLFLL